MNTRPSPIASGTLRGRRSPLLALAIMVYWALWLISPVAWAELWYEKRGRRLPYWCMEVFVVLNLLAQGTGLVAIALDRRIAAVIALYGLGGVAAGLLRDAVYSPLKHEDKDGGFISIRNRPRWMLLSYVAVIEVVLSFAILFLVWGAEFCPPIADPTTALYHSAATLTTLGYGDILPASLAGKNLVIAELLFFLAFLGVRLPLAVSVLRVKASE
jgi:Ion channel